MVALLNKMVTFTNEYEFLVESIVKIRVADSAIRKLLAAPHSSDTGSRQLFAAAGSRPRSECYL